MFSESTYSIAPSDYTSTSGDFDMTDSNTVQCIPITIISDSTTETDEECFTYTISTTSTAAGLTLNPTSATICITDEEESKSICSLMIQAHISNCVHTALAVTVGLQQSYYPTVEGQGSVEVCLEVLSGDITGNSFVINYSTTDGLAKGIYIY